MAISAARWHFGPDSRFYLAWAYHYGGLSEHDAGKRSYDFLNTFQWFSNPPTGMIRRIEHCPAASRTHHLKIPGPNSKSRAELETNGRCKYKEDEFSTTYDVCHLILSFAFVMFAAPLSSKERRMSNAKWHICTEELC